MASGTRERESALPAAVGVEPAPRLRGELWLPGDKSISHRALMLAVLAEGRSRIDGAGDGEAVRSSAAIARALGAAVERDEPDARGNVAYRVASPGIGALRVPAAELDCGNSGTTLRLFAGILAGQPFETILDGDASLRRRPMARIIDPLRARGAEAAGHDGGVPPLRLRGQRPLRPIDWSTPVPSAQVKSCILFAGLAAAGTTRVREAVATRDHTERMLRARGVAVRSVPGEAGGAVVELDGPGVPIALDERVAGDPSAAAFWLVAAATHPDAELRLRQVGVNPTRRAGIDLLRRMGASIEETPEDGVGAGPDGELVADIVVRSSVLEAIDIEPGETAAAIDEIPVLCLAATQARGRTTIRGAGELRHKESDRIAGVVSGLRTLGARVQNQGDDLVVDGPVALVGAAVDSHDDHRLAMTFAVAALAAQGHTTIHGAASAAISYPTFFRDLERIRS